LSISNGGTGKTSFNSNQVLYGNLEQDPKMTWDPLTETLTVENLNVVNGSALTYSGLTVSGFTDLQAKCLV
jgi:hypothetical protein